MGNPGKHKKPQVSSAWGFAGEYGSVYWNCSRIGRLNQGQLGAIGNKSAKVSLDKSSKLLFVGVSSAAANVASSLRVIHEPDERRLWRGFPTRQMPVPAT